MLVGARWQTRVQESNIFGERADKWVSSLQASLEPRPANAHCECPRKQPRSQHTPKSTHWPTLLEAESTGVRAPRDTLCKRLSSYGFSFPRSPLQQRQTLVFQRPLLLLSYPNPADPAREGQNEKEDRRVGERSEGREEERRQREKRMEGGRALGYSSAMGSARLRPSASTSLNFLFPLQAGGVSSTLPCPELPGKSVPCLSHHMPSGTLGSGNTKNEGLDVPPSIPWQPTQYPFSLSSLITDLGIHSGL